MSSKISINPDVLGWAIQESQRDISEITKHFPKLAQWMSAEDAPTFAQLKRLSAFLYVPFGYMFLNRPPKEPELVKQFRTINNRQLSSISKGLKDTLSYAKFVSTWMSEQRREEGEQKLGFIGLCSRHSTVSELEAAFLDALGLYRGFGINYRDTEQMFMELRERMESIGVLVFRNGKVGNNTRRPLNTDEFRAFSLYDQYAPLIFINSTDSRTGQTFSLVHEFTHLLIGETGVTLPGADESVCNRTAVALLMPDSLLAQLLPEGIVTVEQLGETAAKLNVSALALAIHLRNHNRVTKKTLQLIKDETDKNIAIRKSRKTSGGPDFYVTYDSNISAPFRRTVASQLREGKVTYTAASQLLGLPKHDTVAKVVERSLL